jgi:hypothetical protein
MHQPPNSKEPEKACPPSEGAVFIDYAFWFADWLVTPVCIDDFLEPDWRLMTLYRDNGALDLMPRTQRETESIALKQNSISNVLRNMTAQSVCATPKIGKLNKR